MMLRALTALILLIAALAARAQTFQEYLKLRKQYGITQAVGTPALETFVGKRTMEVRGTVKGTFSSSGQKTIMLEWGPQETILVQAKEVPDWLEGNEITARLLIRAERESDLSELKAFLIGAASDSDVAAVEAREFKKTAPKAKVVTHAPPKPANTSAKNWNLPVNQVTPIYAGRIKLINPRLSDDEAYRIATGIIGFSMMYGVDARLIMAMVMCESGFNPNAVSRVGAVGLGQLMPGTARGIGVSNSYDSIQNLYGTVRLIRGHLEKYSKSAQEGFDALVLALAAYNAGSGAVRRYNGVPPYQQTQNYIRKVITLYRAFSGR